MEDGLLCALTYRHTARLYATYSLLTLALPTHWDEKKTLTDALKGDSYPLEGFGKLGQLCVFA